MQTSILLLLSSAAFTAASIISLPTGIIPDIPAVTLTHATLEQLDIISATAQLAGASTHILGYESYGALIPDILRSLSESLRDQWVPSLSLGGSLLPACPGVNVSTATQIPLDVVAAAPWGLFSNVSDRRECQLMAE